MESKNTEKTDYWNSFTKTGSVSDYLSYATCSSFGDRKPERERFFDRDKEENRSKW